MLHSSRSSSTNKKCDHVNLPLMIYSDMIRRPQGRTIDCAEIYLYLRKITFMGSVIAYRVFLSAVLICWRSKGSIISRINGLSFCRRMNTIVKHQFWSGDDRFQKKRQAVCRFLPLTEDK